MGNLLRQSLAKAKAKKEVKDMIAKQTLLADSIKSTPVKGKQMQTIDIMSPDESGKDANLGNPGTQSSPNDNKRSSSDKKVATEVEKEKEEKR